MMMPRLFSLFFILCTSLCLSAQKTISPEEVDQLTNRFEKTIAQFEGVEPIPFRAPDIYGEDHFLVDHKGQIVILQFWQLYCEPCRSQMPSLQKILADYKDQSIAVLSFADDYGEDLETYVNNNPISFPVIPNSRALGMDAYAGSMGYPRVFIIDQYGIIRKLILGGSAYDEMDLYKQIKPLIETYLKE